MKKNDFIEIIDFLVKGTPLKNNFIESVIMREEGMTNRNYLAKTITGEKYIVRIPGLGTSEIIDRKSEWDNHRKIANLFINVNPVLYLKNSWIKVSGYIDNKFDLVSTRKKQIDLVCKTLKVLHGSNIKFENRFWVGDVIEMYEAVVKRNKIKLDHRYYSYRNSLKNYYETQLYENMHWTACHNDLVKENIIYDGKKKLYLIDWEYSGMNDPLWDITSYSLENQLNNEEQKYFLQQYYGPNSTREINTIVALFKVYQDILWYLWAKIKEFHGVDYSKYSTMRLNRAAKNYRNIQKNIF